MNDADVKRQISEEGSW